MPLSPYDPAYGAIPVPEAGVLDTPTIQVNFNPEWAAYIDGAVARLLRLTVWQGDEAEQAAAVDEVRKFLALLQERNPGIEMTDQAANTVYSGPTSGAAAPPAFRAIVPADIATALTTALTTPPAIGTTTPAAGTFSPLTVIAPAAGTIAAIIKGFAAQTADLLQIQTSAGVILNAFKPDGNVWLGNVNLNALALNVYRAAVANNAIVSVLGAGMTNGGAIITTDSNAVTGSIYAITARVNTTGDGYFSMQQNGNGNSVFLHRVIGTGDGKSVYQKNGGTTWALGYDQSDSERFKISANFNIGTDDRLSIDVSGLAKHLFAVSGTNTVVDAMTLDGQSTGTPAAGFGSGILTTLESSTTLARKASIIETLWNTPTDAGAIPDLALSVYYNAGGTLTKREGIRFRGDSAALKWVIGGGTPTATETVTGSRGGNAALADLLTKLAAKGIIVDGSS